MPESPLEQESDKHSVINLDLHDEDISSESPAKKQTYSMKVKKFPQQDFVSKQPAAEAALWYKPFPNDTDKIIKTTKIMRNKQGWELENKMEIHDLRNYDTFYKTRQLENMPCLMSYEPNYLHDYKPEIVSPNRELISREVGIVKINTSTSCKIQDTIKPYTAPPSSKICRIINSLAYYGSSMGIKDENRAEVKKELETPALANIKGSLVQKLTTDNFHLITILKKSPATVKLSVPGKKLKLPEIKIYQEIEDNRTRNTRVVRKVRKNIRGFELEDAKEKIVYVLPTLRIRSYLKKA